MMKIATWNVNSLRVRLPQVLDWLGQERPDVLALQETKVSDADFPEKSLQAAGYHVLYSGQPAYNGVALLSLVPPTEVQIGLPGLDDPQRRFLAASYAAPDLPGGAIRVVNLYVPNGQEVGGEKYVYKLHWLSLLTDWLREELSPRACPGTPSLVMLGDYNIAPEDRDVHDPVAWRGSVAVSEPERAAFQGLLGLGLADAFRLFEQEPRSFSWWDYRSVAFRRNLGLRIDHILVSRPLVDCCVACRIDKGPRALPRPSDHAPVVTELSRNRDSATAD